MRNTQRTMITEEQRMKIILNTANESMRKAYATIANLQDEKSELLDTNASLIDAMQMISDELKELEEEKLRIPHTPGFDDRNEQTELMYLGLDAAHKRGDVMSFPQVYNHYTAVGGYRSKSFIRDRLNAGIAEGAIERVEGGYRITTR